MAELRIYMELATLGILLFTAQIHSQKILSDWKKCGDPQCESLMMRVSAKQDYSGPDCRFLTFKAGHEINVYYKLSGRREDLWQGSTGKAYGFFPKDTVTIEEVYLREEIEIPAQEIDFVCLDGGEYFFENEDSVLRDNDADRDEPIDRTPPGGGHLTEESLDITTQETPVPEAPVKEPWAPTGIAGWFGIGKTKENKDTEIDGKTESLETKNEEAEPQKPLEEAPAETSGWLGGRLKKFLPFGGQGDNPQAKNDEEYREDIENASNPTQQTDQEPRNTQEDSEDPKSKWFNFGLRDVLGFGAKSEKKEAMRQSEEGEDNVRTPENLLSQDKAMDGHLVPDQLDVSRTDQADKTKGVKINPDIQVEDPVVTNTPEKDDNAKEELNYIKDIHGSEDRREDAMTEMDRTSQAEGGEEEEKPRTEEAEDSTPTSGSDQVDESIDVSKNIDVNEYSDTMSQGTYGTEMDNTFQDEGEHDKKIEDSKKDSTETCESGQVEDSKERSTETSKSGQVEDSKERSTETSESGQAEDSRDHADKNVDVNEYSDTLSQGTDGNGLIHGVSSVTEEYAKDEVHNLNENQPEDPLEDALTETGNTFQDEGEHDKQLRQREEHSTETSKSGQGEDSREHAAKNMDVNGNSDTLLPGTDVNRIMHEVSSIVEEHAKDEARNLKETHDEKPRREEAEHLPQTLGSSQADDSREHVVKMNGYSDTLSHEAVDRYKPGTDNHDETEVINHEETDRPKTPPKEGRKYEERLKRLQNVNPKKIQKGDEEQNVDDRIYSTSQHIIDESGTTGTGSLSTKSEDYEVEGTVKESAEDKPVYTTMDHEYRRGLGSKVEEDSQWDPMGSASPQIKSQEGRDNGPDTSEPEDGSSQCDAEGGCTVTTSPEHLWKRPQGTPEASAPIQLYAWAQAFTVTLRKIISGYGEVFSRYLIPVRSQVTSTFRKVRHYYGGL